MDKSTENMSDHDLLIAMHSTLGRAVDDIQKLDTKIDNFNNNYAKKLDVDKKTDELDTEIADMQNDIKWLQRIAYVGMGILGAMQVFLEIFKK